MDRTATSGWRYRFYLHLAPAAWPLPGLSPANRAVALLIVLSVAFTVVETELVLEGGVSPLFEAVELAFSLVFAVEYVLRVWSSVENPLYGPGWRGRLRFMRSPAALLDLAALSPLLLAPMGSEAFVLRLARFLRILRLARLGRFSEAVTSLGDAIRSRRYELWLSVVIAGMILLVSSTLLYVVEGDNQPEAFGSIPRAMWWSIATLTTVGYGDIVPHTLLGRLLAGLTALTGIGLIAMPTGILASAFSDALQRRKKGEGERGDD